jgi:Zn-dependent M28 family amino/carboxypeptidase
MFRRSSTLALVAAILAACFGAAGQQTSDDGDTLRLLQPGLDTIKPEEILENIKKLASDEFEGRAPGTRGETLTVNYLVDQFKHSGLKPGNPDGTYIQNVPLVGYRTIPRIEIEAGGQTISLKLFDDFVHDFPALRTSAAAKNAGVVFAGYGIVAPEYGWDDYKGVDVRNKLVIVLSGEPSATDKNDPKKPDLAFFRGDTRTYYSTRESKFDVAAKKGAAGILVVYDPERSNTYSLFQTFSKMEGFALKPSNADTATVISGLMTVAAARRVFSLAGHDLDKMRKLADQRDFKPVSTSASANISVTSRIRNVASHNVIARIEGSDPRLKSEFVIYSAHWDHLGRDPKIKGDQIYNGAIDNAIGTAQLLQMAKGFARLPRKPKRSILFMAVTAEEKGYLGSRYYAQHPLFPIARTVANINLDGGNAWGRTKDILQSNYGLSTLDETLDEAARMQGREFVKESLGDGGYYFGSDQIEFAKAGIPAAFPFSGFNYAGKAKEFGEKMWDTYSDKDYHQTSDEIKPDWDLSGAAEDAQLFLIAGYNIAQAEKWPEWKAGVEFKRR